MRRASGSSRRGWPGLGEPTLTTDRPRRPCTGRADGPVRDPGCAGRPVRHRERIAPHFARDVPPRPAADQGFESALALHCPPPPSPAATGARAARCRAGGKQLEARDRLCPGPGQGRWLKMSQWSENRLWQRVCCARALSRGPQTTSTRTHPRARTRRQAGPGRCVCGAGRADSPRTWTARLGRAAATIDAIWRAGGQRSVWGRVLESEPSEVGGGGGCAPAVYGSQRRDSTRLPSRHGSPRARDQASASPPPCRRPPTWGRRGGPLCPRLARTHHARAGPTTSESVRLRLHSGT